MTNDHDFPSKKFIIRSPCEVTFPRTPFSFTLQFNTLEVPTLPF